MVVLLSPSATSVDVSPLRRLHATEYVVGYFSL